jgi:hypothetical protein
MVNARMQFAERARFEIVSRRPCYLEGEDRGTLFEAQVHTVERATSENVPAFVDSPMPCDTRPEE